MAHGVNEKLIHRSGVKADPYAVLGAEGKIILKWILEKQSVDKTGPVKTGSAGGLL
jgi:hypothetical protein